MTAYLKLILEKTGIRPSLTQSVLDRLKERKSAPNDLTTTQQMFLQWNAERLGISIEESKNRYFNSWKIFDKGHQGDEFGVIGKLIQEMYEVFADNSHQEIFDAYKLNAPHHFLRMLSYAEPEWNDKNPVIQELGQRSQITIMDFGCGLAQMSRTLSAYLLNQSRQVNLVLLDIPTIRKEFLLWQGNRIGIPTTFLDCTMDSPIPELPACDVCFATEFFEHVYNPLLYFERIHAALNAGGLLITHIRDHYKSFCHVSPNLEEIRNRLKDLCYEEISTYEMYRKK